MIISEILPGGDYLPLHRQKTAPDIENGKPDVKFADTLKELVGDVNDLQIESGELTEKFIKGEPVDLHDVMISAQKAKTSFEMLLELRNKFTDMYREVSRIQV